MSQEGRKHVHRLLLTPYLVLMKLPMLQFFVSFSIQCIRMHYTHSTRLQVFLKAPLQSLTLLTLVVFAWDANFYF